MRRIVTALSAVALAFSLVSLAGPANAAVSGYDSQYAGESAFLTLSPGQSGTFTVFFANAGTTSWVKGTSSQVDLAACLADKVTCNSQDATEAGFNPTGANAWLSATRYTTATQATVAPGQIGTFSYTVLVPATQVPGVVRFNGALVLSATGADIRDEGYFQDVNVTFTTTIAITSCGTSPTNSTTTTVTGTGAGAAATVAIKDGTTQVATATADSTGAFSASVAGLTAGAHSFTASTPQQTSAACSLTVDTTAPTVTAAAATNLAVVNVTFSKNMNCASVGTGSYTIKDVSGNTIAKTAPSTTDTANGIFTITASGTSTSGSGTADCLTAKLTITGGTLTNGTQYAAAAVSGQTDAAGNAIGSPNSATFVATQTAAPTVTAAYRSTTVVRFTYSAPMTATAAGTSTFGTSIANTANYTVDGTSGTAFGPCTAGPAGGPFTRADCTLATGTGFTTASHTFTVGGVTDVGGNTISPNPTTITIAFPPTTTRPTVSSVTAPNLVQIAIQYAPASVANMGGGGCATLANYALNSSTGTATTLLTGASVSCSSVTNKATITLAAGTNMAATTTYQLVMTGIADSFGNVINPNPTSSSFTTGAAVTPVVSSTSTLSTSALNPCTAGTTGSAGGSTTGPCSQTAFTITWNVPMAASATNTANLSFGTNTFGELAAAAVGDRDCVFGTTDGTAAGFSADTSSTNVLCTLTTPIQPGTYTLTITGGAGGVTGRDGTQLASATITTTLTFADLTRPTATSVTNASQAASSGSFQVNFSEVMNTSGGGSGSSSVLNPANYKLDNNSIVTISSSNTTIQCGTVAAGVVTAGTCNSVVLTITNATAISVAGSPHTLIISGVTDVGGVNTINPNPTSLAFNGT